MLLLLLLLHMAYVSTPPALGSMAPRLRKDEKVPQVPGTWHIITL